MGAGVRFWGVGNAGGGGGASGSEPKTARLARLEAENTKLMIERDILRAAAKYFAGGRLGEPLPVR
jgi:transposase-like protein